MKQKIVYFVHCFPPAIGGLEFLSGEIVKILRDAGHDVQVIAGRGQTLDSYKTFNNWVDSKFDPQYIHRLPLNYFWQRLANKFLNKLIFVSGSFSPWYFGPILKYDDQVLKLIKEADLIFGAGMPTKMFYDAYRLAKKFNKKLILHPSYHNVSYYKKSIFFQKALSFADKVIYQTPFEKDGLKKSYQIEENKLVQLTYSPYSKADWQMATERAKLKEKEINNKIKKKLPITIGFVGQITLRKNFQFFIDFLDQNLNNFIKQGIKVNFLFAGARTNSSKSVESLFDKYENLVKFMYDFSEKDKAKIFKKIDIFVNPSLEESLGLINFDAIYWGLPCFVGKDSAFYSLFKPFNVKNNNFLILNFLELLRVRNNDLLYNFTLEIYRSKLMNLIDKESYKTSHE